MYRIPFNKPGLTGNEFRYMADAVTRGHSAGDGSYTRRCHTWLEQTLGSARALLTTSCTHALELAALLLDIQPGDEVIVPSFTFVSTANAFVLRGAKPVFVDIRADTLNLDERLIEAALTPRTKAIVAVHYAGVGCDMAAITSVAQRHGLAVVEDNAHGLSAKYRGQCLGTFGDLATLSFHETKNVICGEGGALLIRDPRHVERAEILREKGTNRSRFFRGEVDKYTWVDVGSSYLMSDILAAFLCAQLEQIDQISAKRKRLWDRYFERLSDWARAHEVQLPQVPAHCEQSYHMFYMVMPSGSSRQALIDELKARGILSVFHYLPLHASPMGLRMGGRPGQCPVSESVSDRLIRLPFYNDLTDAEQDEVVEVIRRFDRWQA